MPPLEGVAIYFCTRNVFVKIAAAGLFTGATIGGNAGRERTAVFIVVPITI